MHRLIFWLFLFFGSFKCRYKGKGKLDALIVYAIPAVCVQQAPGGRDNAKVVSKVMFEDMSLADLAGSYFLNPDFIMGSFLIDPARPAKYVGMNTTVAAQDEVAADMRVKKVLDKAKDKCDGHISHALKAAGEVTPEDAKLDRARTDSPANNSNESAASGSGWGGASRAGNSGNAKIPGIPAPAKKAGAAMPAPKKKVEPPRKPLSPKKPLSTQLEATKEVSLDGDVELAPIVEPEPAVPTPDPTPPPPPMPAPVAQAPAQPSTKTGGWFGGGKKKRGAHVPALKKGIEIFVDHESEGLVSMVVKEVDKSSGIVRVVPGPNAPDGVASKYLTIKEAKDLLEKYVHRIKDPANVKAFLQEHGFGKYGTAFLKFGVECVEDCMDRMVLEDSDLMEDVGMSQEDCSAYTALRAQFHTDRGTSS